MLLAGSSGAVSADEVPGAVNASEPGTAPRVSETTAAPAQAEADRVWEVGGVRLEAGQVERLADDMARRTVETVEERVAGIALSGEQRSAMLEIYRAVALDVYGRIVDELAGDTLPEDRREDRLRELALAGQSESHARLSSVLDERQMTLYSAWEDEQVAAFKSQRSQDRRRRRRR